jgi:uncharacterized protein YdeI (BOF family)
MKRHSVVFVGSLVMAGALVAAQGAQAPPQKPPQPDPTQQTVPQPDPSSPPPQEQKRPAPIEVTLTGCLIQGSGPDIFILDNARVASADRADATARYILSEWGDFNVKAHLDHEVTVTGSVDVAKASVGKAGEKDLPRIAAAAITMVSDRCAPAR